MKPLRMRLLEARKRLGIPWEVLERDYLLSWFLAGIGQVEGLRDTLVFKGGTALKKCYFGDYRFSEDLDFTGVEGAPTGAAMEEAVRQACHAAGERLGNYAPVEIFCERYAERQPHPSGQEAFTIRARLPWQREPSTRVMIETALDEPLLRPARTLQVIHEYGEPMDVQVQVYGLEEMSRRSYERFFNTSRSWKSEDGAARAPATTTISGVYWAPTRARWTWLILGRF